MSKALKIFVHFVMVMILLFSSCENASFAKKKKNKTPKPIEVVTNDGERTVNGSVLNPNFDELNILIQSLLTTIKKGDLNNVSVILTSIYNSTASYIIPADAISIQRKKLKNKKKNSKYLVVNLFNLQTPSGVSVSPSSLPNDSYKLKITGKKSEATTESVNYRTPVLIVGNVSSMSSGLVSVEDLDGNTLSESTVVSNPNGTFFTEVRANKIDSSTQLRNRLNQSTGNTNSQNNLNTGIVHVVAEKELLAITPLSNKPEINSKRASKPLVVNEASTLSANLARANNKELANDIAQEELNSLESEDESVTTSEDIDCDLNIFADLCTDADEETLALIGSEFKEYVKTAPCNFPGFNSIKNSVLSLPEEANVFVGEGYCKNVERGINENKPCEVYAEILNDFKAGSFGFLPCPPPACTEFQSIKPPKCVNPQNFCENRTTNTFPFNRTEKIKRYIHYQTSPPSCINKPVKDLFCAKVGVDIKAQDCKDFEFGPKLGWTVVTNSKGNQFCVPTILPEDFSSTLPISLIPELLAEECELNACHKNCDQQFDSVESVSFTPVDVFGGGEFKCDVCDCHFECDAQAGRFTDCGDPTSRFFSKECCDFTGFTDITDFSDFNPLKGPIPLDISKCLCENLANFNEKGFVKEEGIAACKDKCPIGYEKAPDIELCLPICEAGFVRDPGGICRRKCPKTFMPDDFGNCVCPPGLLIGINGQCQPITCPEQCKNIPLIRESLTRTSGKHTISSTQLTSLPPECFSCFGIPPALCPTDKVLDLITGECIPIAQPTLCPPDKILDSVTGQCILHCPENQYFDTFSKICRCFDDSIPGPLGCKPTSRKK